MRPLGCCSLSFSNRSDGLQFLYPLHLCSLVICQDLASVLTNICSLLGHLLRISSCQGLLRGQLFRLLFLLPLSIHFSFVTDSVHLLFFLKSHEMLFSWPLTE